MPLGTIPDTLSYGAPDLASSPPTSRLTPTESKALLAVTAGPFLAWGGIMAASGVLSATASGRLWYSYWRSPVATVLRHHGRTALIRGAASASLVGAKAYRYAGYYQFYKQPFATIHYIREGEYEKAMIQYFGPIGSVFIYNKYQESRKTTVKPDPPRRIRPSRKPSEIPKNQKMRLWRMGLRWCRQHGRYDRCSLRARR